MQELSTTAGAQDGRYFVRLQSCIFISFGLLIFAAWMQMPPWVGMLGGIAPLVYYHLGYLAPRAAKGLTQTAIDSVYYFGFLVTIAALGVSAVTLALTGGKEPLVNVAFQFGLGLLATGYAIFARMHLNVISVGVDETSPEEVLDRYVQRSRELVTNVELASESFVQLAGNLMAKSQEVADTARQTTEKAMLNVAKSFDEQMRTSLDEARRSVNEIRGLVSEVSFVKERDELARSVQDTLKAVTALNTALNEFSSKSLAGAKSSEKVAATQELVNAHLTVFSDKLELVGGTEGQLAAAVTQLAVAQSTVATGTEAMGKVVQELTEMAGDVSSLGPTFKSIRTLGKKAHEQMDILAESAQRLHGATSHLEQTAGLTQGLADGVERAARTLPALGVQADLLCAKLGSLGTTTHAVEQQLDTLPRSAEEAFKVSAELKSGMESVAQVVESIAAEAKALHAQGVRQSQSLENAARLAHDAQTLQTSADAIQKSLQGFSGTVQGLGDGLHASTENLKTALDTATLTLESQVQRSAAVAQLFGERMNNVAQIIIDRTREARAA